MSGIFSKRNIPLLNRLDVIVYHLAQTKSWYHILFCEVGEQSMINLYFVSLIRMTYLSNIVISSLFFVISIHKGQFSVVLQLPETLLSTVIQRINYKGNQNIITYNFACLMRQTQHFAANIMTCSSSFHFVQQKNRHVEQNAAFWYAPWVQTIWSKPHSTGNTFQVFSFICLFLFLIFSELHSLFRCHCTSLYPPDHLYEYFLIQIILIVRPVIEFTFFLGVISLLLCMSVLSSLLTFILYNVILLLDQELNSLFQWV